MEIVSESGDEEVSSFEKRIKLYSVTRVGRIMWLRLKSYVEKSKRCKIISKERSFNMKVL